MSDSAAGGDGEPHQTNGTTGGNQASGNVQARLLEHIKANKIDSAMWATRILSIFFFINYLLPLFMNQQSCFNKVLIANAATSALRLHQRLPTFAFTREFLARLMAEDSCHYLIYSFVFFNNSAMLMMLVPIVLFAVLHASSYTLKLLDLIGQNSWWGVRFLISLVEFQAGNILKVAALSEIFLMPLIIILTFTGRAGFMVPFFYYHFLVMRYSSRRNPTTRNVFGELRMATESAASRSPAFVARILHGGINFVCRLKPQEMPRAQ